MTLRKSAEEGQGQWVCDSVDSPFLCGTLAQPAHFPSEGKGWVAQASEGKD